MSHQQDTQPGGRLVGYARVSTTKDQTVAPQLARLREYGCDPIYSDEGVSGARASRPEWDKCLKSLQRGDVLVAVRLDRFGRSVRHLLELAEDLRQRGVDLKCLDQPIDTTTPTGRLVFGILSCVAEFERDIIRERILDGLAVAVNEEGKTLGAPRSLSPSQEVSVSKMTDAGMSPVDIAGVLGVSRSTVYRTLARLRAEKPAA